MDYSNNTKVIQWHKNLWKSDKTNNKFMEKLGKRTKHTFGNWQINWLSNHVSKILTQSVVDKYIKFLGFFYKWFFFSIQNTDLKVVFCIHIIKPLVCLCVCLMLRPVHIFGPISNLLISTDSPWYREGLKIISRVIGAGTKKNLMYTGFFKSVKNVHPTDVHPTDVCPTGVHRTDVCLIGVSH